MAIRNATIAILALLMPLGAAGQDLSAEQWEAHLLVTDGLSKGKLSFGVRPDATEGWDRTHEVSLLAGSGLRAYFQHGGWPGGSWYVREVKGPGDPRSVEVVVDRPRAGQTVTIGWNLQWVPYGCARVDLRLEDLTTGESVDMRRATELSYVAETTAARRFRITWDVATSVGPPAPAMDFAKRAGRSRLVIVHWKAPKATPVAAWNLYRVVEGEAPLRLNDKPLFEATFQDRELDPQARNVRYFARSLNDELCEGEPAEAVVLTQTHGGQ